MGSLLAVKQRVPLRTHLQPEMKVKITNMPSQVQGSGCPFSFQTFNQTFITSAKF
jgi:hypothetical protein